jgi:glycosyltransferase involved in cell wall biosynthesis
MLMMSKPRILLVNESSFHNSGYAVYGRAVQERLHATGKYEIAELGCYATDDDPRRHEVPWRFYGNAPAGDRSAYDAIATNQFGEYRFNDIVLDFRPDIVWDIRDWWMLEFAERSPFRDHFRWAIMPTVDATPQAEGWIATYASADAVLTYSDWGQETLHREGGGLLNLMGSAPPGADTKTFVPMDKQALRRSFGFRDGINIVGTIMRNQPRKLYPQLIDDFATFARVNQELGEDTYLYLHTTYPDRDGWDLPRLIKNSGVSHKILVTYKCRTCNAVFPSLYQDARTVCPGCRTVSAVLPNVTAGVDRASLAKIINLFDVYVQYANSEGFGMPQVEAAACGVPVMATDYSAMSDVVRKLGGFPIFVDRLDLEQETGCLRAKPERTSFVTDLRRFLELPHKQRRKRGGKARAAVLEHYDWDKTAARWERTFDALMQRPKRPWDAPPRIHRPPPVPRYFPTNEQLVEWAYRHVLGRPEMAASYAALRMVRDLNWGSTTSRVPGRYQNEEAMLGSTPAMRPFGPDDVIQELSRMRDAYNAWEEKRCQ